MYEVKLLLLTVLHHFVPALSLIFFDHKRIIDTTDPKIAVFVYAMLTDSAAGGYFPKKNKNSARQS